MYAHPTNTTRTFYIRHADESSRLAVIAPPRRGFRQHLHKICTPFSVHMVNASQRPLVAIPHAFFDLVTLGVTPPLALPFE